MDHGIPDANDPVVQRFRRTLERNRLATTYLLVGPHGAGKRAFATWLARALLCQQVGRDVLSSCDVCQSCQLMAAGNHPDLLRVAKPADKSSIPIALFIGEDDKRGREGLCHDLALRPAISGRRVAVIDDADFMQEPSANCLLKTLEEPPPRSLLLLIAENEARVIPTIRSRSQIVRFPDRAAAGRVRDLDESSEGVQEVLDTIRAGFGAPTLDPIPLGKKLEQLVGAFSSKSPERRALLRFAINEVIRIQHSQLLDLARRNDHLGAQADAAYRRLERSMAAAEEVDRNANTGTLLQAYLQELAEL